MSYRDFRDCIKGKLARGEIEGDRAKETLSMLDEFEAAFFAAQKAGDTKKAPAEAVLEALKAQTIEKKRRLLLQAKRARMLKDHLTGYRNAKGDEDWGAALVATLARDELSTTSSVEARQAAIRGRAHARLDKMLAEHHTGLFGQRRNKAGMRDIVREAFGRDSGNQAAKEMAGAWATTADFLRKRFNAAGGRIPRRADWGLPQMHDTLRVRKASRQEWIEYVAPRLDAAKMIDEGTGQPFSPSALRSVLGDVYNTIRTDGWAKLTPNMSQARGRALANRRADHRFLVFRDADSWLEYNDRFGANDPFSTMMAHIDGLSRDIAMMEILGPNPTASLSWMEQLVEKRAVMIDADARTVEKAQSKARSAIHESRNVYGVLSGRTSAPVNGQIARGMMGVRSLLQSAQLGAAAISAISDAGFQKLASEFIGMPATASVWRAVKLLNPANEADRMLAVRAGLIAEEWSTQAAALARYTGDVNGPEVTKRLAEFTMKASGLSAWTQAGRHAFGLEFMGFLADNVGKPFAELSKPLQRTLKRYGLDAGDWAAMGRAELYEHKGVRFLRPEDLTAAAPADANMDALATRLLEMIQTETEYAVPSASIRGRAAIIAENRPGTATGELLRSVAMYKSFAVTVAFTHIRRGLIQQDLGSRAAYLANFAITTSLMGALALQLKEISKGRDPRPMTGKAFWGAAMMQGGGLGIFGDFMFSDLNRFGGSLGRTVAGPVVGAIGDTLNLTLGNAVQAATGQDTKFGREMMNYMGRYTPGGSLWYGRLAYERLLLDTARSHVDPDWRGRARRLERRYKREFNQGYWWRPHRKTPERVPDLTNIVETEQ